MAACRLSRRSASGTASIPPAFEAAVAAARAEGRSLVRAVLAACPGLGPVARARDGRERRLVRRPARAAPRGARRPSSCPGRRGAWHDADLADPAAVALAPILPTGAARTVLRPPSWLEAGAALPRGPPPRASVRAPPPRGPRRRAPADPAPRAAGGEPRPGPRGARRRDATCGAGPRPSWPSRAGAEAGRESVEVEDPYEPGRILTVALDPRLGGLANAERMFDKARRIERARHQVELRLRETRSELAAAREREALVLDARDRRELPGPGEAASAWPRGRGAAGPRHYLTAPRSVRARRPQRAREPPPDLPRGARPRTCGCTRATCPARTSSSATTRGGPGPTTCARRPRWRPSSARRAGESLVDVHVTRRKHVRPARGGPGRVFVAHSDTLRVAPRDPEGRLRQR